MGPVCVLLSIRSGFQNPWTWNATWDFVDASKMYWGVISGLVFSRITLSNSLLRRIKETENLPGITYKKIGLLRFAINNDFSGPHQLPKRRSPCWVGSQSPTLWNVSRTTSRQHSVQRISAGDILRQKKRIEIFIKNKTYSISSL